MKAKSFKKLFVIKEICSWLQTFRPFNQEAAKRKLNDIMGVNNKLKLCS